MRRLVARNASVEHGGRRPRRRRRDARLARRRPAVAHRPGARRGAVDRAEPRRPHLGHALHHRRARARRGGHGHRLRVEPAGRGASACRAAAPPACWSCRPGTLAASGTRRRPPGIARTRGQERAHDATGRDRDPRPAARRARPAPTPPAPPSTIAETGLHPDTLAQLMLKTLIAGESSGTQLAESLRLPYSVLDAMVQHARVEKLVEVRGASGAGSAGYRYALTDLGRDRAMQFLDISRYVGPAPVPLAQYNAYVRACMAARPWIDRDRLSRGFEHLDRQPGHVRPARAGRELRQVAVPLRRARQRQDRRRRGHRPRARQRACTCRTPSTSTARRSRCSIRSTTCRTATTGAVAERRRGGGARSPLGADPAAGGRRRRRADARHARPDVQPDRQVLRSADPDEGQRRRVRRRRLRPPAHSAARPAEPLDRPAREPRRLPDAAHGPQVRDPVQRLHHLRDQPEAGVAGRRSVPAPHPVQDPREEPDGRGIREDLRAGLPQARPGVRRR